MSTTKNDTGLQKIDVKIPLEVSADFDYDTLIEVFGRWRVAENMIDLADYLHVPDGPGCLLVSHDWHFGVDRGDGEPGVFLSNRQGLDGDLSARIGAVLSLALEMCQRLLQEPSVSTLNARLDSVTVTFNDRTLYPNSSESDAAARPELERALAKVYGTVELARDETPKHRLSYRAVASTAPASLDAAIAQAKA